MHSWSFINNIVRVALLVQTLSHNCWAAAVSPWRAPTTALTSCCRASRRSLHRATTPTWTRSWRATPSSLRRVSRRSHRRRWRRLVAWRRWARRRRQQSPQTRRASQSAARRRRRRQWVASCGQRLRHLLCVVWREPTDVIDWLIERISQSTIFFVLFCFVFFVLFCLMFHSKWFY